MKKIKVGLAFPDYILNDQVKHKRGNLSPPNSELLLFVPLIILGIIFGIILMRLLYLQVLRKSYYERLSYENRTRTETIPASRGIILDRKGRALVANIPAFKLVSNDNKVQFITKEDALARIADGEKVDNDIMREYLYPDIFAHVLGYVGQISEEEMNSPSYQDYSLLDIVGKIGIEKEYESVLHGQNGRELHESDAMGKKIRSLGKEDPEPGKNLTTTLDIDIQKNAYDAMKNVSRGAVVVSDPRDGAILSIVSRPAFDTNLFTHPISYEAKGEYVTLDEVLGDTKRMPALDRAIGGVYPPGSTFKLITAAAALEEKEMNKDTQVEDTGVIELGGLRFGTWYYLQYGRKEGKVDMVKAIARSNDIYFYRAAEKLGDEKLSEWAHNFGLGGKLGIDIAGEERGTVPNNEWKIETLGEKWYTGDTFNMGIGQGYLLTTPLQVNAWTNVFANDGVLYRPHLVVSQKHVLNKNFVSKKNIELIREGMRQSCATGGVAYTFFNFGVVNRNLKIDDKDYQKGTSQSANFVRIPVGCKTGTAQTPGDENEPHAWITVFAPYFNPEISITVLVEHGGEGSKVAGPIATEILKKYFERK